MKKYFFVRLIILILVSGTFLYFSFSITKNQMSVINDSIQTTGIVVSYAKSKSSEGKTLFSPTVEYIDNVGVKQQFTSRLGSSNQSYGVGEVVNILVPKNYGLPQINSYGTMVWRNDFMVFLFS